MPGASAELARSTERVCGRCGRIDEIAIRATAVTADICVNCYRLPVAVCDSCARRRPCYHVAEGGYVRQLLVAHGALPERNESIAWLEQWIATTVARIDNPEHRRLVHTFATWQTVRRLRRRAARIGPTRRVATRYSRNQVAAAVAFLGWLDHHNITLAGCAQEHINIWLTTGPASRRDARHFLAWTAQRGVSATFTISAPPERDGDALDADQRWSIARRLLHDDNLELLDRVAGSFVLLYAQPLSRVAVLTREQVTTTSATVSVRFGRHAIEIPAPLDRLVATLASTGRRPHTSIGAPTTSPWLFPGHLPGRPITASRLGARLGALGIDARAARRSALIQLAAELPAPVLADTLGIKITTASDWVKTAGGDWSNYAAAASRTSR